MHSYENGGRNRKIKSDKIYDFDCKKKAKQMLLEQQIFFSFVGRLPEAVGI